MIIKNYKPLLFIMPITFIIILGALFYNGILWFVYPESKGYSVKGIDVARYQGNIDWQIISKQEIKFAFIKATEGSSYSDPLFNTNIVESKKNKISSGAYHFFSTESSGKTQAQNFIRTISSYELDLPPVLDFEVPKTLGDKENIIKEAAVFLQEVEMHTGVKPIIYTTSESYDAFLINRFDEYPLWFRDLFKEPVIANNRDWIFWQYCNRGRLNGIGNEQNYVDLNVFNGTETEFESYIHQSKNLQ